MGLRSGFPNERLSVLPRPRLKEISADSVLRHILVTDCGFFPNANDHERIRPSGSTQAIIIFCVDGRGWANVEETIYSVKTGQVLLIDQNLPHSYGASQEDPWTIWWMHIMGEDVQTFLSLVDAVGKSALVNIQDLGGVVNLFNEITTLMEHDDSLVTLHRASGAGWHLLADIAVSRNKTTIAKLDPAQIAIARLQRDFDKEITVAELAKEVGLSSSHFSTLFRHATGFGPRNYQTRLRMLKARQLLDTTELPISQIARMVGYQDPLHFSRRFHEIHKVSPSQHRARAKG